MESPQTSRYSHAYTNAMIDVSSEHTPCYICSGCTTAVAQADGIHADCTGYRSSPSIHRAEEAGVNNRVASMYGSLPHRLIRPPPLTH